MDVEVLTPLFEFMDTVVPPVTFGGVGVPSAPQDAMRPQNARTVKSRIIQEPLSNALFAHAPETGLCLHSLS
jgi:hypothetical protein